MTQITGKLAATAAFMASVAYGLQVTSEEVAQVQPAKSFEMIGNGPDNERGRLFTIASQAELQGEGDSDQGSGAFEITPGSATIEEARVSDFGEKKVSCDYISKFGKTYYRCKHRDGEPVIIGRYSILQEAAKKVVIFDEYKSFFELNDRVARGSTSKGLDKNAKHLATMFNRVFAVCDQLSLDNYKILGQQAPSLEKYKDLKTFEGRESLCNELEVAGKEDTSRTAYDEKLGQTFKDFIFKANALMFANQVKVRRDSQTLVEYKEKVERLSDLEREKEELEQTTQSLEKQMEEKSAKFMQEMEALQRENAELEKRKNRNSQRMELSQVQQELEKESSSEPEKEEEDPHNLTPAEKMQKKLGVPLPAILAKRKMSTPVGGIGAMGGLPGRQSAPAGGLGGGNPFAGGGNPFAGAKLRKSANPDDLAEKKKKKSIAPEGSNAGNLAEQAMAMALRMKKNKKDDVVQLPPKPPSPKKTPKASPTAEEIIKTISKETDLQVTKDLLLQMVKKVNDAPSAGSRKKALENFANAVSAMNKTEETSTAQE